MILTLFLVQPQKIGIDLSVEVTHRSVEGWGSVWLHIVPTHLHIDLFRREESKCSDRSIS